MSMAAKVPLVILAILLGIIAGLITAMLMRANGASVPAATLGGGGSAMVTIPVVIGIFVALGLL